jgi:threonylcarbamoyladenosine tRNA methylthiotransferase MtaB
VKYSIITFGCRVNQADSLEFEEDLRARGGTSVDPSHADLVVVNTCSVTATSDQGARQTIRRVARDNPGARIVVTGCYATRRPAEIAALPNVVRVVDNEDKPRLLRLIGKPDAAGAEDDRWSDASLGLSSAERFSDGDGACGAAVEPGVAGRTAFTLRVQTGCAEPCSYCIIPTTRGRPRSVPVDRVMCEIDRVAWAGFREVALTGVHLGSYGRDLTPGTSLVELLTEIDERARAWSVLFRISSLEPMDCSREIVDLVAAGNGFAPHFHLPLQHASNRVLAAMRRPYTIEYFASLVDEIRARIPAASIGSDVIVGFPDETDDDFEQLTRYLERSPLTHLHVFPYSDRPGTAAAAMRVKVPGAVVRGRAYHIRQIARGLAERFQTSQIGTIHRALTLDDGTLAVTDNYLKLRIPSGHQRNEWVKVKVAGSASALSGEIIAVS